MSAESLLLKQPEFLLANAAASALLPVPVAMTHG